jgi:hypothetical protein
MITAKEARKITEESQTQEKPCERCLKELSEMIKLSAKEGHESIRVEWRFMPDFATSQAIQLAGYRIFCDSEFIEISW